MRRADPRSPFSNPVNRQSSICNSFTLVELMVVATLMSIAVGMFVFRLDGVTDQGRLRSTAGQLASVVGMARTNARLSGVPGLIEYELDHDRISVRAPEKRQGTHRWGPRRGYDLGTGVRIQRVLIEGSEGACGDAARCAVRIGADGRLRSHAVVLTIHGRCAVVLLGGAPQPRILFPLREPVAGSYDLLTLELQEAS